MNDATLEFSDFRMPQPEIKRERKSSGVSDSPTCCICCDPSMDSDATFDYCKGAKVYFYVSVHVGESLESSE